MPVTYHAAAAEPWPDQRDRWDELDLRHHMTRAAAILRARGEFDPARHAPEEKYPLLALDERLELLARGEVIARHYRHPALVHAAVMDGATWEQIAEATGSTEARVRADYRAWAEGQHRLWQHYEGKFGMDEDACAAAIERAQDGGR